MIDLRRRQASTLPLEEASNVADSQPGPEEELAQTAATTDFWQVVNRHLVDERERVLVHLKFAMRLRPAEILHQRPDLFPTIDDVYRISRNILERLRRSPDLRRWLGHNQQ